MTKQSSRRTDHSHRLALAFSCSMAVLAATLLGASGCSDGTTEQASETYASAPDADSNDDASPELRSSQFCHTRPAVCPDSKPVSLCGTGCLEVRLSATMQDRSPHTLDGRECLCRPISFRIPRTLNVTAGDAGSGLVRLTFRDTRNGRKVTCEYRGNGSAASRCHPGTVGDRYNLVRCDDGSRADEVRQSDWFVLEVRGKGAHASRTTIAVSFSGPNTCCQPKTCAGLGVGCGKVSDGCGGTLDCGACCQPLDACHLAGVRDPQTGLCSNPPAPDGTLCDDGNQCTHSDACTSGLCGGTPYTCSDGLACTSDSCDGTGSCIFTVNPGYCVANGVCHEGFPEDPVPAPPTSNEPNATTLTSSYLGVDLSWDGRFTIGAHLPTDWNILYGWPGWPWTTSLTVRVDNDDVAFGDTDHGEFVQYPYSADQQTSVSVWKTGPIKITQTLRIVTNTATGNPDTVKIQYDVANTDSDDHQVGLRMLMDTMINGFDGAPFRLPGRANPVTTETELLGDAIPEFYQVFFDLSDPVHVVQGSLLGNGATRPDRFAMVSWNDASQEPWDYAVTPDKPFGDDPNQPDSGVLLYWNPQTIQAGAARRYVTYYGLGAISGAQTLGLSGPARLGLTQNAWSPNPFTVIAYLKNTELVSKVGESLTLRFAENNGLALAPGETAAHVIPEIPAGATLQTSWQVVPGASGTWSYSVSSASNPTLSAQRSVVVPQPWTCGP